MTTYAWRLGKKLNKLKTLNKKIGGKWEPYRQKKFPYISAKKAQRYMRLAQHIDLKKFPILSLIPICELESFILLCKEKRFSIKKELKIFSQMPEFEKVIDDENLIKDCKKIFKEIMDLHRKSSPDWSSIVAPNLDYQSEINENRGIKQKIKRMQQKSLKKEGKIHSGELIISTNRAAKKLVKNFDLILNKKYKIVKSNDFGDLDYETIKNLFAHLKQLKALHKTEFARNHDMPGEDDV
ncbi:hypothetical protein [Desulfotignum phosphitoxidans]|nr:hypothetical protein [Desulfotignum phosphitoxidans]EMS78448.1 hypothetical protein Dpo_8c01150 [Desulfotignum phosphitoxidans DSM 13687]